MERIGANYGNGRCGTNKKKAPRKAVLFCLVYKPDILQYEKAPVRDRCFPFGAADEARTRYLHLGKVALYQMSYSRILYRAELISAIFIIAESGWIVKQKMKIK